MLDTENAQYVDSLIPYDALDEGWYWVQLKDGTKEAVFATYYFSTDLMVWRNGHEIVDDVQCFNFIEKI